MSMFLLYVWFVLLPNLSTIASIVIGASLVCLGLAGVGMAAIGTDDSDVAKALWKFMKQMALAAFIAGLVGSVAPDQKQAYMMAGGYAAINSEQIKQLPESVAKAANAYLEKLSSDLSGKEESEKKKDKK